MTVNEIPSKRLWNYFFRIVLVAATLYIAILFFDIILMLSISILLGLIFNPLVTFIESKGVSRLLSVLIVFVLIGVAIYIGVSVLIPKIGTQLKAISATLNKEEIAKIVKQVEELTKNYIPFIDSEEVAAQLSKLFSTFVVGSINNVTEIVSSIFSILAILVIVPFMTFFLLKDNKQITKGIINIMPNRYFEMSYYVMKKISIQLGRFVRGWILDAFIVGLLSGIGLSILGIQNSVTIGVVAGIGHLIPYFGPIIGGIPAILISIIQFGDLSMLPSITVMFILVYTFDNGFIQPNVFSKSTDMHPLMIILLILVGSQVLGIFGMLIAIPTATVIKTAVKEIYIGYKTYKIIRVN